MLQSICSAVGCCILFLICFIKYIEKKNLPPGPFSLPFIGNYRGFNGATIYKRMVEHYVPIYGKLVTLFWGNTPIVFINDYDYATKALCAENGKNLGGRMSSEVDLIVSENQHNIFGTNYGPIWLELIRRLKLGVTKCGLTPTLEVNTKRATDFYCAEIMDHPEHDREGIFPFDESYWLSDNIVLSFMIGRIFKLSDKEYRELADSRKLVFSIMDELDYVNWIPYGRHLPTRKLRELTKQSTILNDVIQAFIDKRKMMNKYMTNPENLIDYLLQELELSKKDKSREVYLNEIHLRQTFKDILFASYEGIGLTNIWFMALLALHPEIQSRIREEVTEVSKMMNDDVPRISWRKSLSYVQAVEHEFFRFSSIVGILDFHYSLKSVNLDKYTIPKGSLVGVNQYAMNHDPKRWPDPETVKPERFLDSNGNFLDRKDLTPFGMGVRMCPGSPLTKGYGFLLLCNLCLRYKIEWSSTNDSNVLVDDEDNAVMFRYPLPYFIKLSKV